MFVSFFEEAALKGGAVKKKGHNYAGEEILKVWAVEEVAQSRRSKR